MAFAAKVTSKQQTDPHCWLVFVPDGANWLKELASVYRALRTETRVPLAEIELDGITFSTDVLRQTLADALLPEKGTGWRRVERSDFAETISYCLLADVFKTRFGYKSVRDRELIQLPGAASMRSVLRSNKTVTFASYSVKPSFQTKPNPLLKLWTHLTIAYATNILDIFNRFRLPQRRFWMRLDEPTTTSCSSFWWQQRSICRMGIGRI